MFFVTFCYICCYFMFLMEVYLFCGENRLLEQYSNKIFSNFLPARQQTHDAVRQSPVADTAACAAGYAVLRAHVDLYDIQCLALPDGCAGRRCRLLSVLLEKVGDCRCDGTLSLAADQG